MRKKIFFWQVLINQGINLTYTVIFFFPVFIFWMENDTEVPLIIILTCSLSVFFLPKKFFDYVQLSKQKSFYRNLWIDKFQHVTQQGKYIQLIIQRFTGKVEYAHKKKKIKQLKSQIRAFESFHWASCIFFMGTALFAITQESFLLAFAIMVSNIAYNVIPILIQQYNKLRLAMPGVSTNSHFDSPEADKPLMVDGTGSE